MIRPTLGYRYAIRSSLLIALGVTSCLSVLVRPSALLTYGLILLAGGLSRR
ncbi:putative conserved membrane protein [Synechococcus sp. BIOS-E4-1]|uniref:hypothetical protein n=1 Tax=unclassified Synechococcus TaxID=2626047 RepID=UPI0007BAE471|nr:MULTISPECIES: hypothetical protein [unclassified Synechococcus]KZR85641.1 hypothetical protein MITS9504_01819 [Synechococcus sp. MIT S9504]KZR93609.1 hypothetical protein MITS9509_00201 [Synechococcus sp. MIT S9509]QNI53016.1 putative conserved membrane protein [Synechococcus sp. BIOS-E4-1]